MRIDEVEAREAGFGHLIGKTVTVLLHQTNRLMMGDEEFHRTYSGRVAGLTPLGLWLERIVTGDRSFFFWHAVQGICCEERTSRDDPRVKAAQESAEGPPPKPLQQLGTDRVKGLAAKAKEEYERL